MVVGILFEAPDVSVKYFTFCSKRLKCSFFLLQNPHRRLNIRQLSAGPKIFEVSKFVHEEPRRCREPIRGHPPHKVGILT